MVVSDFDHNLKTIASAGSGLLYRNLGIAAYIVEAYRKQLGNKVGPVSKHIGTEKARLSGLKLIYKGNASFDGRFGTLFIHRFSTEENGSDHECGRQRIRHRHRLHSDRHRQEARGIQGPVANGTHPC